MDFFNKRQNPSEPIDVAQRTFPILRKVEMTYQHLSGEIRVSGGEITLDLQWWNASGFAESNVIPNPGIEIDAFKANNALFPFVIEEDLFDIKAEGNAYEISFNWLFVSRFEFHEVIEGMVFSQTSGKLTNITPNLMNWVSRVEDKEESIIGAHAFFCDPDGSGDRFSDRVIANRLEKHLMTHYVRSTGMPTSEWLRKVANGELKI